MTGVPTISNRETVAAGTRAQDQVLSDNRLPYCTTHEIHESRVRELLSQLDEAETFVKSLRSDSASERLKGKQMINDMLEREQALTDENIILKNANEDLRVELNGTIHQREYEKESLSQGQTRELALAEENSKLKLENSELKRDNKELRSKLQEGEEQLPSERFNF
jgi:hypothetical protein